VTGPATVARSWKDIEAWLAEHTPLIRRSLRPPTAEGALDKLEKALAARLPGDVKACYRIHDGQRASCDSGLFPAPAAISLGDDEPAFRLLGLREVAGEWKLMKELLDGGEFRGRRAKPQRGIRPGRWNAGWVPIAGNGAGDFYCIDLDPAASGTRGQVIVVPNDLDERVRVAPSLRHWLARLAAGLRDGEFGRSDEDEGLVWRRRRGRA
jgi:cell wall assembly regulator SMI1